MTNPRLLLPALLLPCLLAAEPVILLNDTFSDGERSTQNLPSSARWFGPFMEVVNDASGNPVLRNSPPSASRHMIAYFAPSSEPVTLAPRQSLAISFNITPTAVDPKNDTYEGFRIGVFHSGASRLTDDSNRGNITPVGGYGLFTNPVTSRTAIRTRTSDAAVYITSMTTGWTPAWETIAPSGRQRIQMVKDKTYTVRLIITRMPNNSLQFDYILSDGSKNSTMRFTDRSESPTYSFDTLAIAWHASFGEGHIDNVIVGVNR